MFPNYKNPNELYANSQTFNFYDRISQNLNDCFVSINKDQNLEFLPEDDFCQIIVNASEAIQSNNWNYMVKCLLDLLDQLSITEIKIQRQRCKIFEESYLSKKLMEIVDECSMVDYSPYILQLFINVLAAEDESHSFAQFNIANNGFEVIMHLKKTLPKKHLPLVFMYAYNIYLECSNYIINETTELFDYIYKCKYLCNSDNSSNFFLIPLAMINLLRNEEVKNEFLPEVFFENLIGIAENMDPHISIFSMWCLYFYFKNSYNYALTAILQKDNLKLLLNLLNKKITSFIDLTETKIALYIFSYCMMIDNPRKRNKCFKYLPIELIYELIKSDESEISALSMALCNNYTICKPINIFYLIENGIFDLVCEIAKNGNLNCKIEAGMLIMTIISNSTIDIQGRLLNPATLTILCDMVQINNNELIYSICIFISHMLPCYGWIVNFLLTENFDEYLESLQESSSNPVFINLSGSILKILNYKKRVANT